jgi:hypothetical protein
MKRSIPNLVSPYFLAVLYHFFPILPKPAFLLVQEYNGASRPKLQRFFDDILYAFKPQLKSFNCTEVFGRIK